MFRQPQPQRRRNPLNAAAAVLAGIMLALIGPVGSALADDTDPAVTWSVQPADDTGVDGRAWIEQTLDPGDSAIERLAVHNFSDHAVDFRLAAADGFFNQNGRFNILPSDQPSTEAGTWIDLADSVNVPAGETVVVPLTITVPNDAQPGDHAAGVAGIAEMLASVGSAWEQARAARSGPEDDAYVTSNATMRKQATAHRRRHLDGDRLRRPAARAAGQDHGVGANGRSGRRHPGLQCPGPVRAVRFREVLNQLLPG